ncbi:MAG TPA: ATP-binding protein [Bryobacteraceae bacterium]|nr:ATP-binding protein [Bryobacteraceae bacterium]
MPSGAADGRYRVRLTVKLAAAVVASFVAFVALVGYLSLREHRLHSEQLILASADRLTDLIQRSTQYQMLRNDRQALYQMINDVGSEPGLRRVRIFNKEGRISFSTEQAEVGTTVDKQAEQCYACHAQSEPLSRLDRPDRARIFRGGDGQRTLGMIRPIGNQTSCWDAACHAHSPAQSVLGVIDANLSLESVDMQLASSRKRLVLFTGLSLLLGSLVSVGFVLLVVHKPVAELKAGTTRVAGGDLTHRLTVRSRDELGELAASFNKMTEDLARAHDEITSWARTLEDRVEKKSQELEQAYSGLVASEKMASLGKLAATVAHEINNPLFGILTYSRLVLKDLERGGLTAAQQASAIEQLHTIERESKRCGEIVRNLLAFARRPPPRKQPQDLAAIIRRALALVRHRLELQGVELEENFAPGVPRGLFDADQVQQVLLVLLVNAAEAMPGGGRLKVSTEWEAATSTVRVRVLDNGVGIAPDVLPHIFEPFFTTKEDQHQTGLGLAVARNIVEQHGGTLTARSTPSEGTEFSLTLTIEVPAGDGGPIAEAANERS